MKKLTPSSRRVPGLLVLLAVPLLPISGVPQSDVRERVILAVGESTTAGYGVEAESSYPSQLQMLLDAGGYRYRVVNHGRSGMTTDMAVGEIGRGLAAGPSIVIVALGGNDRSAGVPPARTRENLSRLVSVYRLAGARVLLADRETYYREVAAAQGGELIAPLLDEIGGRSELLLSDGFHPDAEGYAIVAHRLFLAIEPYLER